MSSLKIKKGDTVLVTTGKKGKEGIKGKQGKVIAVLPEENKVVVDGLRIQKRHTKPRGAKQQAGIIEKSGPIDASNVMVICPKCGKPTRVGYAFDANGNKIRVCKRKDGGAVCGASLDKGIKTEKADKKAKAAEQKAQETEQKAAEKPTAEKATKPKTAAKKPKAETAEKTEAKKPQAKKRLQAKRPPKKRKTKHNRR